MGAQFCIYSRAGFNCEVLTIANCEFVVSQVQFKNALLCKRGLSC